MKIEGREMPADYKYGTAGLGEENIAKLQAGELVSLFQNTQRIWNVGEIVEVPIDEGQSLWARVVSKEETTDPDLGSGWNVKIQLAGD
jgi:hypothetical protein